MESKDTHYQGSELELFAEALVWKTYLRRQLSPYIVGDVLEVGAGIGTTTVALRGPSARSWTALEPDPALVQQAEIRAAECPSDTETTHRIGTISDLHATPSYDTILYVDVLEHIEDDHAEVAMVAERLRPGGHLVVLAPAHQWLFTPFDDAIGHHRRYSRATLRRIDVAGLRLDRIFFLDSVGLAASGANRLLLRSAMPTRRQIKLWDRVLVRASQRLDPLLGRRVGKSVAAIWTRERSVEA